MNHSKLKIPCSRRPAYNRTINWKCKVVAQIFIKYITRLESSLVACHNKNTLVHEFFMLGVNINTGKRRHYCSSVLCVCLEASQTEGWNGWRALWLSAANALSVCLLYNEISETQNIVNAQHVPTLILFSGIPLASQKAINFLTSRKGKSCYCNRAKLFDMLSRWCHWSLWGRFWLNEWASYRKI